MPVVARRDPFEIDTDPARLDVAQIHAELAGRPWWRGITPEVVRRGLEHALCFGIYDASADGRMVGYARVITDRATFGYLTDAFIAGDARGRGLYRWLLETVLAHPELRTLRRWLLISDDAALYARFGFTPLADPHKWLERHDPDVYTRPDTPLEP